MKQFFLTLWVLVLSGSLSAAPDTLLTGWSRCAEGMLPRQEASIPYEDLSEIRCFPLDSSVVAPKGKKLEQPSYQSGGGLLTFWIGTIALLSGYFSTVGILIEGGIFALLGVSLLIFYNKIKKINPFRIRGRNIVGKIILAIFFLILLLALIGAIIMAFVVSLALLLAAILSTVVSPVVVAGVIMGIGVLWMLIAAVVYLIKNRRYKKSLQNG